MANDAPPFQAGPRIWLQLLEHEWEFAREGKSQLRTLRRPSFALSERMTSTLGRWDAGTRTITLSERLLHGRRWHLLVSTLRHEVAHQIVSELWRAPDEPPHGPTFRRACQLLGVSAEARATVAELEEEREEPRAVRTIRRLLALSSSPNRHEAEAALARAQELALKHNVALSAGDAGQRRYAHRLLDRPRKRWPSYTWTVLHTCEELHQVQHIRWTLPGGEAVVELFGAPDNLDLAEYVYHYLLQAGETEWQRFRREQGLANNRKRLSFLLALYTAFDRKLAQKRQELAASQALVVREDVELNAFFRRRYPHVRTGSTSSHQVHDDARAAGTEAGGRLQIRPGVRGEGEGKGKPKALPPGRGS